MKQPKGTGRERPEMYEPVEASANDGYSHGNHSVQQKLAGSLRVVMWSCAIQFSLKNKNLYFPNIIDLVYNT